MNGDMTAAEYLKSGSGNTSNPFRQIKGKQSRAAGQAFERLIIASCELYKNRGVAFIEKTPEPMKILAPICRQKGIYKACFEKSAQPDFKGTLASGQAVCFEAKHTDTDRISQDRVTSEQAEALGLHFSLGAACFILVSISMQSFYRVPWDIWNNMRERFGHKFMTADDLSEYRIKCVCGNILFLNNLKC